MSLTVFAALVLLSSSLGATVCDLSCSVATHPRHHALPVQAESHLTQDHHHHEAAAQSGLCCELRFVAAACNRCCDDSPAVLKNPVVGRIFQLRLASAGISISSLAAYPPIALRRQNMGVPLRVYEPSIPAYFSLRI